jgi:hypothetical protein
MEAWNLIPIAVWAFLIYSIIHRFWAEHRTVATEQAVVVRPGRRPKREKVSLDQAKEDAVEALMRDGWKRPAAVSALASIGWRGYPDTAEMVLSAWQSMPGWKQ